MTDDVCFYEILAKVAWKGGIFIRNEVFFFHEEACVMNGIFHTPRGAHKFVCISKCIHICNTHLYRYRYPHEFMKVARRAQYKMHF